MPVSSLAVNWLVPGLVVSVGLAVAGNVFAAANIRVRAIAVLAVGALALAAFIMIEPRCVRGPFALADDLIRSIWLDQVDETEPLMQFIRGYTMMAIWLCAFPIISILAAFILAGDTATRRDSGFLVAASALVLSIGATMVAVKVYSYAMWFGMPMVAAAASRITLASGARTTLARFAVALICAPLIVTVIGTLIAQAMAASDMQKPGIAERVTCTRSDAYVVLAQMPKGLVATHVNYGSYALALTPHDVLAAPYHRLRDGIIDANAIFNGTPQQAHAAAMRRKIDYIAVCGTRPPTPEVPPAGSLWSELNQDRVPAWLERVPGDAAVVVYRVRREGRK